MTGSRCSLYDNPGLSYVDSDLNYPLMDWGHWGELVSSAGLTCLPKPLTLRWPYECHNFTATQDLVPLGIFYLRCIPSVGEYPSTS